MANPLQAQGTINRLKASIVIPGLPGLNVTSPFLGKAGITLALNGPITTRINTMTGQVTSPEPYQLAVVTVNLLRTQALGAAYKAQLEADSLIGDITVHPDTPNFGVYPFSNCSIDDVREQSYAGEDPGFVVTIGGIYYI